ncbi:MAG: ATP-dependent helicase [Ruminococcaceae bacterium]|nr:ATP-dependent helicase [Oscillospiraceae bacterium]
MHRVKGLEFDHMILVAVNEGILPLRAAIRCVPDLVSLNEVDDIERALLYVAATRAKKTLHVLCHGVPSKFLCKEGLYQRKMPSP